MTGLPSKPAQRVATLVRCIDDDISIHDFRMVSVPPIPMSFLMPWCPLVSACRDEEVASKIKSAVRALDGNYYAVVNVERSYT